MKRFFLTPVFFLALSLNLNFANAASNAPWSELKQGDILTLSQNLIINQKIGFRAGLHFRVRDLSSLGPIQVEQFELDLLECNRVLGPTTVPMTILQKRYGFEMQPQCQTQFYVEFKDLFQLSYFQVKARRR